MIKHLLATLLVAALLSGCAAPVNRHTATNYYQAGETALAQGNLAHARQMFSRALINARLGNMGPEAEGQVLAKLGRVFGNLCQYDEAEKAFSDAISVYSAAFGEKSPRFFPTRMELAQFSYDIGRYEKAVGYFDQAFPFGIAVIEKADPPGYVAIMKDYADALSRTGKADLAKQALSKAAAVEGKESGAKLTKGSEYVRYPSKCG
jgi:tetratricopeptide (TPR) repeat protein